MLDANLNFSISSIFPPLLESQLPTFPPRLRRNQERSVAENTTLRSHQYWLVGVRVYDAAHRFPFHLSTDGCEALPTVHCGDLESFSVENLNINFQLHHKQNEKFVFLFSPPSNAPFEFHVAM